MSISSQPHAALLKHQVIFITGAGFDIGKALARYCAGHGAQVILMDSDIRALNRVYDEIMAAGCAEPIILKLKQDDLKGETAALIREQIMDEYGKLDALVHTANAAFPLTPVHLLETETLDKAHHVLSALPQQISRELLPVLKLAKQAAIVFTSHFSAQKIQPFWGYHSPAFSALEAASRQWAADTANINICVNSVDPGKVNTAIRKKHYPAEDQSVLRSADDAAIMDLYLPLLLPAATASGKHFSLA